MVFRNRSRGLRLRPVNRIKHVVDSQFGTALGAQAGINLIIADDDPVIANTTEVLTGSSVNAIYLKVEATTDVSVALNNFYLIIVKNPGGNITPPAANLVGASDNKRFVIHQEMVMLQQKITAEEVEANPRIVFQGVIMIPRGYRRFAPNDVLKLEVLSPGGTTFVCVQCHYKEFR